jgi:hypothetical protein
MSGLFWWSALRTDDLLPQHRAAEIGDRHLDGLDAALPDHVGVDARQSSMSPITTWLAGRSGPRQHAPREARRAPQPSDLSFMLFPCCVDSDAQISCSIPFAKPELGLRELFDDPAVLHHIEAVRQRSGEAEVLLHHDDGEALRAAADDGARQLVHDHRRQPLRDLVQAAAAARRCAGCAPPPASAARRPTGACPGWRAAPEIGKHARRSPRATCPRGRPGGSSRFSSADRLEDAALLGAVADAEAAMRCGGSRSLSARRSHRARTPRPGPGWPCSVVVRPAPLRPSSVTTSPSLTVKSTPCRMCDSPYQACRPADAQQSSRAISACRPKLGYRRSHVGLDHLRVASTPRHRALGDDRPRCSTVMVSAMEETTLMLCSTMSTVRLAATCLISA